MTTVDGADGVFAALADPTRRYVLRALVQGGPSTATALAARLPVSRQAVGKHLAVLERAGLVHARRVGRESRYVPQTAPVATAASWLTGLVTEWDDRLARLAGPAEDR
jgi:DNA-binding transcriptional ArsR family regulator